MKTCEKIYSVASLNGLFFLNKYIKGDNSPKTLFEIEIAACICAEIDKTHKKLGTRRLQKFVWTHGYIKKECSHEDYENSGYFDEDYLEKIRNLIKQFN